MAILNGTSGDDSIDGTLGDDTIRGEQGNDILRGGFGNDVLDGGTGYNSLYGEGGNDTLLGGDERDFLDGGDGDDSLVGGADGDYLDGGYGSDSLLGGAGNDTLLGGYDDAADTLRGGDGADLLFAYYGNNVLDGGEGNDTIDVIGYLRSDSVMTITGGGGVDEIRLNLSVQDFAGSVIVTDFVAGAGGDRLDVDGLLNRTANLGGYTGGNPFNAAVGVLQLVQSGADTLLQWDRDGPTGASAWRTVATLQGVTAADLTAENFKGLISPDGREFSNRPPVLDPAATHATITVDEGAPDPVGLTVAQLVAGGSITDEDGAVEAIAIEALDTSLGTWQYKLDGTSTWLTIDAALLNSTTNTLALLLGPNDSIRLLPFGDLNGSVAQAITFRAWDISSGSAGQYVVTTPGSGAFSADADTAALTVLAVNDQPTFDQFAGTGKLLLSFGGGSAATSVLVQPDGRIVLAGGAVSAGWSFGFARLNADGSLDQSFGSGGTLISPASGIYDAGTSACLQADGKILLAGFSYRNADYTDLGKV